MAKRRKLNPEVAKLKRNLQARVRRYNKDLEKQGIPSEFKLDLDFKSARTKKQVKSLEIALVRAKNDPIVKNSQGLYLRASDVKRINKAIKAANKRLREQAKQREEKAKEIAKKWGKPEESAKATTKEEKKVPQYTRKADDFKTYKQLLEFEKRLNEAGKGPGLEGDALKDAILKAIRGEKTIQANGFKFRNGVNNPLAEFIEKELTGEEVEYFFGGNLNFGYIYSAEHGLIKEFEIIEQIVTNPEYPNLKDKWEEDYAERWHDYMEEELELVNVDDYIEESAKFDTINEYLKNM